MGVNKTGVLLLAISAAFILCVLYLDRAYPEKACSCESCECDKGKSCQ